MNSSDIVITLSHFIHVHVSIDTDDDFTTGKVQELARESRAGVPAYAQLSATGAHPGVCVWGGGNAGIHSILS